MSPFGTLISEHRQRLGLSSARVGELVGRSPGTVRGWERGRSQPDDPVVVSSLAAVLGIEEADLFVAAGMEPPRASTPFSLEETLSTIAPTTAHTPSPVDPNLDSDLLAPAEGGRARERENNRKLSDVDTPLDKARTALESMADSWRQQQQRSEPTTAVAHRTAAPKRRSMSSLSYMEDVEQRWSYRVRSVLTAAGIGLLGIVLLWAGSQLLGAVGDVWNALTAGL